jgi:hypothetical protein
LLTLFTTFYPLLATILLRLIPDQSLQQTFAASPSGGLQVKTDVGKINITTHDNPSIVVIVEIEGKINGGGPKLILHTSGGSVKIRISNNISNLM